MCYNKKVKKNKALTGREVHHLVESARESGKAQSALELAMHTLLIYAKEGDHLGYAEVLDSVFLTLKNLHRKKAFKPHWILAGAMVRASVEIAEQSGIKEALALPQFNLAQYLEESGKLVEAKEMYEKAISSMEQFPSAEHSRPAVLAQMKLHLALCELILGDREALGRSKKLLAELAADTGVDSDYNCKVWISGGYLRLALYFKDQNIELAREYLQQAQEIIEGDKRLVLRREHLAKILSEFKE